MISPDRELKDLGLTSGVDVVGIAAVADINKYAPEGYRPEDLLAGARSVLVFGGQIEVARRVDKPEFAHKGDG